MKPGCKACEYSTHGHCANHPPSEAEKQKDAFDQLVEDISGKCDDCGKDRRFCDCFYSDWEADDE